MARMGKLLVLGALVIVMSAAPAFACGGLLNPRGNINLLRTTTFAGYHAGIEHYVTSFEYAGGGAKLGSIVPLPGVPTRVIKGGDWTLQRLVQEVNPAPRTLFRREAAVAANDVEVLEEKRIGALDVTILRGGGDAVGRWASDQGFDLPPDAPEMLDFYAKRSPVFMAARFDVDRAQARSQQLGDATPVHLVIPTPNPWVPLRILGLGRGPDEPVEADVFLLTDSPPAMLPRPDSALSAVGIELERSATASRELLADLRSDRGMRWLPRSGMHLSYLSLNTTAGDLDHDLALDVGGTASPSPVAAGLAEPFTAPLPGPASPAWAWVVVAAAAGTGIVALANRAAGSR